MAKIQINGRKKAIKQNFSILDMLKKYSSSSSNGIIYELSGDILYKQNKITLAKDQYLLAKDKYSDELSLSIISMKISNIEL